MGSQFQNQSRKAALCGMMAALSAVILTWGALVPLATFACPMLAMLCMIPAVCEYGTGTAVLMYAAVSVLGLLLCPDKEIALLYVFLGWYPGIRPKLEALPRLLGLAAKCALFSLSMVIMYAMILYLFQLEAVAEEFAEYSNIMIGALLLLGNVTFLLYDRVLSNFSRLYRKKRMLEREGGQEALDEWAAAGITELTSEAAVQLTISGKRTHYLLWITVAFPMYYNGNHKDWGQMS